MCTASFQLFQKLLCARYVSGGQLPKWRQPYALLFGTPTAQIQHTASITSASGVSPRQESKSLVIAIQI